MLKPDAHVNVKFYETVNGGRKHPTLDAYYYGVKKELQKKQRILFVGWSQ